MNKGMVAGLVVVLVLVVGGGWYFLNSKSVTNNTDTTSTETQEKKMPVVESEGEATDTAEPVGGIVKEFTVTGKNFRFDPAEIRVKKGDTVRVLFKSGDMTHDFMVDEFEVATDQLSVGEEEEVEFVADKTGTFEYYCSVGQHRANGMVGNLIVE